MDREQNRIAVVPYTKVELEGDILELLCLQQKKNNVVTASELCRHFDMGKKTLTSILKPMQEKGYLQIGDKSGEIILTPYGISEGNEYIYRHDSISQFLQFIGVSAETADRDACRAEHILTDETIRTICDFANRGIYHDRKLWNTELTDRYEPGVYEFMMQIYSMERCRPRKFREEYEYYTENIYLEVGADRGWFELERRKDRQHNKTLWYKCATDAVSREWNRAQTGERGERLPANAFEFVIKPNAPLIEGHLLIAFTEEGERPDLWSSCQLEVEIW